jgi:hypothetical protein
MSGPDCLSVDSCEGRKPGRNCRRCSLAKVNADPGVRAKRSANRAERMKDPIERAKVARYAAEGRNRWLQDPENMEKAREQGRWVAREVLFRPDVRARNQAPEVRAAAGRKTSAKRLAFLPLEYRDNYRDLISKKRVPKAEAVPMMLETVERDTRRYLATGELQQTKRKR